MKVEILLLCSLVSHIIVSFPIHATSRLGWQSEGYSADRVADLHSFVAEWTVVSKCQVSFFWQSSQDVWSETVIIVGQRRSHVVRTITNIFEKALASLHRNPIIFENCPESISKSTSVELTEYRKLMRQKPLLQSEIDEMRTWSPSTVIIMSFPTISLMLLVWLLLPI